MKWSCHGMPLLARLTCRLTARLPSTGPSVQNPIAEARPTCGLKSRIMAGVATRITPSTNPMASHTMAKLVLLCTCGTPARHSSPTTARPVVMMLARPSRSAIPASSDATAPASAAATVIAP
jgi:hypothetical protein